MDTNVQRDWIVGSLMVCLDRAGSVEVTKVEPSDRSVQITGFGIRPNPALHHQNLVGALSETLATAGIAAGPRTLSIVCDQPTGNSYELVVQLHGGASSVRTDGLDVTYVSDGQTRQLHIQHGLILCAHPQDKSDKTCKI